MEIYLEHGTIELTDGWATREDRLEQGGLGNMAEIRRALRASTAQSTGLEADQLLEIAFVQRIATREDRNCCENFRGKDSWKIVLYSLACCDG